MIRLLPKQGDLELSASLKDWIPKTIIDSHVHLHKNFGKNLFNLHAQSPGQTFNWFDLNMHKRIFNDLGIHVQDYRAIVFGLPFVSDVEEKNNNDYLQKLFSDEHGIYSIPCLTTKTTREEPLDLNCYFGVKTKISTNFKNSTSEIINNFPKKLWNNLDSANNFLIIHLPKNIYDDADELIFLANKYKNINFVIAHLGGFYLYDDKLPTALRRIEPYQNIFFDTSMVTDSESICSAITILGCQKILFGSDAPFGYLCGKFLKYNGRIAFQPDYVWPWYSPSFYPPNSIANGEMVCLQSILAIKQALEKTNQNTVENKNLIFFRNALKLLKK